MLSGGVLFIGMILCFTQVTSYVLLTANVADIRNIASKFLSASIVEQLTNLVKKVSQKTNDLSQENEYNVQSVNKVSEEAAERARSYESDRREDRHKATNYDREDRQKATNYDREDRKKARNYEREDRNKARNYEREDRQKARNNEREDRQKTDEDNDVKASEVAQEDSDVGQGQGLNIEWNDSEKENDELGLVVATSGYIKLPKMESIRQGMYNHKRQGSENFKYE